jgi:pSer/pThr/pTyr-binding forkhead associated (FHA) protein
MVLIFMGRRGWGSESRRRNRKEDSDPVTQPVTIRQEPSLLRQTATTGLDETGKPDAMLRLVLQGEGSPPFISLDEDDITLGSDRRQAQIWLDSPSIDPLHARITLDAEGAVFLSDLGSVAGTWVNYTPISSTGVRLEDGDLVRIGKMSFRFQATMADKYREEF